jgi:hypothetical protein
MDQMNKDFDLWLQYAVQSSSAIQGMGRWGLWSTARDNLEVVISRSIESIHRKAFERIIIFGAGAANDLPMQFLCEQFQEILLVDIDAELLEKACLYVPQKQRHKVIHCVWDVSGYCASLLDMELKKHSRTSAIIDALNNGYVKSKAHKIPQIIIKKAPFSIVLSDLLLTRICIKYLAPYFSTLNANFNIADFLKWDLDGFIKQLIDYHLNLLNDLCDNKGDIILTVDTFLVGRNTSGQIDPFVFELEKHPCIAAKNTHIPDKLLDVWLKKYAIPNSNILKYINPHILSSIGKPLKYWWWWPFSKKKVYLVLCYVFRKGNRINFNPCCYHASSIRLEEIPNITTE